MGNSFLLIIAGLLLFYLVISDKWNCLEGFAACVVGKTGNTGIAPTTGVPAVPQMPTTLSQIALPNLNSLAMNSNWAVANGF